MTDNKTVRVLVLDADMVPALTIARSLARRRCVVDVASSQHRSITTYSKSISQNYVYPDPLSAQNEFILWMSRHTQSQNYDLVIPVTERTLVPISSNRDIFTHVNVTMPGQESLDLVLDKSKTLQLAKEKGVPIPTSFNICSLSDLTIHTGMLKYPVVLKPARSLGTNESGSSQLTVSYAFDEHELRAGCEHALSFGPVVVQEYIEGNGVGIELIAKDGEVFYALQHLRLHEVPITGGGSSFRKTVSIDKRLLASAKTLISALGWNGVAMVEFKVNPQTGEFSLMEINGRFWGSLPLADAAGADFPSMLLDLEIDNQTNPSKQYRENVYCRKLSSDLSWYEAVIRANGSSRIVRIPSGGQIIKELGLFFSPKHYFDVQSFRDPKPGLVDIFLIATSYFKRLSSVLSDRIFLNRQKKAWSTGSVAHALKQSQTITFLCYGNINRSALADVLSRPHLENSGRRVISAGFHTHHGREADPVMVEVARRQNVDMTKMRSITVTDSILRESDIIFVMDKSQYIRIQAMLPSAADRTWLLGAHGNNPSSPPEIPDPYGKPRESYENCYRQVSLAVSQVKTIVDTE